VPTASRSSGRCTRWERIWATAGRCRARCRPTPGCSAACSWPSSTWENTGQLEEAFLQLANYFELELETRKRIKTAMRYPSFVLIAIGIAMVILNIMVIPVFAGMFAKFGVELPLATRILLATSHFFVHYWWRCSACCWHGVCWRRG
jgi:hypothetical protein